MSTVTIGAIPTKITIRIDLAVCISYTEVPRLADALFSQHHLFFDIKNYYCEDARVIRSNGLVNNELPSYILDNIRVERHGLFRKELILDMQYRADGKFYIGRFD